MSQEGILQGGGGSGAAPIETLTANTGGPVGPDAAFNINLLGSTMTGITTSGNPGTNTITVSALQSSTGQFGTIKLATDAQAIAGTDTNNALTSSNLAAKLGTQTANGVAIGNTTSGALNWTSSGNIGEILTSNGPGFDPTFQPAGASSAILTITGNSGGPEVPLGGNFNILGTGSITIAGSANTETVQLTGLTNHAVLIGAGTATITKVGPVASTGAVLMSNGLVSDPGFSTATYPATTTVNQILYSSATNVVSGITAVVDGVLISDNAAGVPSWLPNSGTPGFVLTANAGAPPSWQAAASSGISTITGNSGGAESPLAGNFNILGTGSITVAGSANTETVQLTGLTNHAVLVGAGTATITNIAATANTGAVLQNNSGADPSYSTATYPSTTTVSQILYSSATNVVSGLATANRAVVTTNSTGVPVVTALASDGQLIIGSTAGAPAAASLTAGAGITITPGSNSITIASTATSFSITTVNNAASPYTVLAADQFLAVNTSGGAVTLRLPNAPTTGRVIYVKDSNGTAVASNISVTTVGGTVTFDGQTTYSMKTAFQSIGVVFDGANYQVF